MGRVVGKAGTPELSFGLRDEGFKDHTTGSGCLSLILSISLSLLFLVIDTKQDADQSSSVDSQPESMMLVALPPLPHHIFLRASNPAVPSQPAQVRHD